MGRFKNGMLFGSLMGAGLMWLNVTKKGRETRDQIFDHAAAVYGQLRQELMTSDAWKEMTQNEYVARVKEVVDRYAVQTGLAKEIRDIVEQIVKTQWKRIKKQLAEKNEA